MQERAKALGEIKQAFIDRMQKLAQAWTPPPDAGGGAIMPEYIRTQETFKWPSTVLHIVSDLEERRPLKEVFSRVSGRYRDKVPDRILGLAEDLSPSPAGLRDGRASAFEDVLKALDIAERDFDITYQPLSREMVLYWQKRHPLTPDQLETAYRENMRHFMKEMIAEARSVLESLRDSSAKAPFFPPPPVP